MFKELTVHLRISTQNDTPKDVLVQLVGLREKIFFDSGNMQFIGDYN